MIDFSLAEWGVLGVLVAGMGTIIKVLWEYNKEQDGRNDARDLKYAEMSAENTASQIETRKVLEKLFDKLTT